MMNTLSLQLWIAIKRPPIHHPLFRRVSRERRFTSEKPLSFLQRAAVTGFSVLVGYILLRYYAQLIFVVIFFLPLGAAALYMALHGTIAGLYWAIRVSSAIAREHERGTYELLSASPYGAFSASWAICTGCQYYDQTFSGLGMERVWFSRIFFLGLILFSGGISLIDPHTYSGKPVEGLLYIIAVVAVLALALHIDDIQSTVLGSLVGLIVPQLTRNRFDARMGALTLFLLLQITAYALIIIVGFLLMPQVNSNFALSGFLGDLLLPLEQLLIFFSVRELIGRILWRCNQLLFNGDVSDLSLLTKGGRLIW